MTEFYMRAMNAAYPHKNLAFRKMHGAGNDFVVIDSRGGDARVTEPLARAIGDRHRGVGFDQLAEIRSDGDGIALDFWNSDGTRAGACGNATRCVAWLIMHEQDATTLTIRTERGKLIAEMRGEEVWVNMGPPVLDWADVPLAHEVDLLHLPLSGDPVAVGMGNPHAVFFVDDVETVDVAGLGSEIETHPLFPEKTNVEFAQVRARNDIRMRVWERGTGITLACGSGACATAVAGYLRGLTDRKVRIQVDGGWLTLDWQDDGVWMTGPVASVFEASLSAEFLASI
ncbi:diaminopimelate epimerase [Aliiroseovarius sp. PTFE2010]|uniref:diaminopimelate epimerase n=1 Tax=Aliiroseovarius sp. PTFE2010 TaxID=3417190 RepID=UPI003CF5E604